MADGQFEHIETDSVADLQLSVKDSLGSDAVADERVSDADYGEPSDILSEDIGIAGIFDAAAELPISERQCVVALVSRGATAVEVPTAVASPADCRVASIGVTLGVSSTVWMVPRSKDCWESADGAVSLEVCVIV